MTEHKQQTEISYTQTAELTIDDQIAHLSPYLGELAAIDRIEQLLESFENRVSQHPESCPISPQLIEIGATEYREYNHDGHRILYRVITPDCIEVDLCLGQRQDIKSALVDYCLIHR